MPSQKRTKYISPPASLSSFRLSFFYSHDFPNILLGSLLLSCTVMHCGMFSTLYHPSFTHTHTHTHLHTHTHAHTHTHTHIKQPKPFPVMFHLCITCIPIGYQVPHGPYSGRKTSGAPATSVP